MSAVTESLDQEAATARHALEKKHAKINAQRAADVADSRERLTAAIMAAQTALLGLIEATGAHSGLIRQHAAELAGLGFTGPIEGCEVGSDPKAGVVVLSGETAHALDPGIVLRHVVERVQYSRLQPREYYRIHQQGHGRIACAASAAVIGLVEPPELISRDGVA